MAIPAKKEFADLAPSRRVFRRWALAHDWNRDVGYARSRNCFYTPWSGHLGDRIYMGQKMARDSS